MKNLNNKIEDSLITMWQLDQKYFNIQIIEILRAKIRRNFIRGLVIAENLKENT